MPEHEYSSNFGDLYVTYKVEFPEITLQEIYSAQLHTAAVRTKLLGQPVSVIVDVLLVLSQWTDATASSCLTLMQRGTMFCTMPRSISARYVPAAPREFSRER